MNCLKWNVLNLKCVLMLTVFDIETVVMEYPTVPLTHVE